MELTLGPVLFEWKRDELLRFYDIAATLDVDRVYIGEVVCSKKKGLSEGDLRAVVDRLTSAGKRVTLSTLAVVSNEDELNAARAAVASHSSVEANDMCVFAMAEAAGGKKELVAGPHITSYNVPSVEFLKSAGVSRVVFPVEMSVESAAYIMRQTGVEGEVFAHGKVPLAFSWRCYTSRSFGLTKTGCRHDCARYPDGIEIRTVDGEPVFTINGTSLLSASTYTLIEFVDELRDAGFRALRISPQHTGTEKVVGIFRRRMRGEAGAAECLEEIRKVNGANLSNGWYHGRAGKDYVGRA